MKNKQSAIRAQLDDLLSGFPAPDSVPVPGGGWVRSIRESLGMTQATLAARLGITRQSVQDLERAEAERRISMESLDRLARALGCRVSYALVPDAGSLDAALNRRANDVAQTMLNRAGHSMALEKQGLDARQHERRRTALVESLRSGSPRKLWK